MRNFSIAQIRFCAQECQRQETDPVAVYNMARALQIAMSQQTLVLHFILDLGLLVDPIKNMKGVRTVPVTFPNGSVSIINRPQEILDRLHRLLMANREPTEEILMSPEEFYKEFQEIHPFIDGNGRVGAILYNYLRGSLNHPIAAPDLFAEKT